MTTSHSSFIPKFSVLIILFVAMSYAVFGQQFEGEIIYEIPEMKETGMGQFKYLIKGNSYRVEYGSGMQKGAMLYLPGKDEIVILIQQMKGYMKMSADEINQLDEELDGNSNLEKTGNIKTIAGERCEVWITTDKSGSYEMCVAQKMGNFMMPSTSFSGKNNLPEWAREAMAEGFMPLEVYKLGENGGKELKIKAVDIKRKALESSLFQIPEGYKDMTSMMKQMFEQEQ